jgi:hypothetical protein
VPRPADFRETVEVPGNEWLASHPAPAKVPARWQRYSDHLQDGFSSRCGYAAMWIPLGTVDHYRSVRNHRQLAYSWENYRFVCPSLNSSKKTLDDAVLDPYEIGPNWFEIILPSLQLRVTENVPADKRARAEFTIEKLGLRDRESIIRWRKSWYDMYLQGNVTLAGLKMMAPLLADAIERSGQ